MKNILVIMKKELYRVFQDKRLVFSMFILPGLLIYILYSFMGTAFEADTDDNTIELYNIVIVNDSTNKSFQEYVNTSTEYGIHFVFENTDTLGNMVKRVEDKKLAAIVIFPENFDSNISSPGNEVVVYYNPTDSRSNNSYMTLGILLEQYNRELLGISDDAFAIMTSERYDQKKANGENFAMLMPFLIMTFLFTAVMSVTPESIAGEKERGTIATLLVTPTNRSHIALGKIFGLSILSAIGAISSFIGVAASLPKIMGSGSADIYNIGDYAMILLILISVVCVIVGLMAVLSAFAKNVKEASLYSMPLMGVVMMVGILSMITGSKPHGTIEFIIPLYNSVIALGQILSFDINPLNVVVTIGINVVYTVALVLILTKMFNNEKIMFNK